MKKDILFVDVTEDAPIVQLLGGHRNMRVFTDAEEVETVTFDDIIEYDPWWEEVLFPWEDV